MKNIPHLLLLLLFLPFISVKAQTNEINNLVSDMLVIADNFAGPGAEGAAIQSSAGWFSTASTLEKWEFEVSVHGNGLFVPRAKQNTLITNGRDISFINVQGSNNALIPTVYGGETDVVFEGEIEFLNPISGNMETIPFDFDAIDGLNKQILIHPFPQVTMGLPYSTEIAVRFLPSIIVDGVGFGTFGVGLKHNLTQYYERRFDPEDFQLAVVATYSNFKVDYAFPEISVENFLQLNRVDVNADLWFFQALASKLYDNFEVLGGLGVTASQFDFKMGGDGQALPDLNDAMGGISGNATKFKGDVGFNYYHENFKFSSMITASNFFNVNIGVHYRFNAF